MIIPLQSFMQYRRINSGGVTLVSHSTGSMVENVPLNGLNICILLIKKYISLMGYYNKIPNWDLCKTFIENYRNIDLYSTYMLTKNAEKRLD